MRRQLADTRRELEETNHGIIALHTELETARYAEARLAAIVRFSDDAIISMTPECVIQTWNPGAHRLLSYSEEDIVGAPVQTLLPPQSRDAFAESLHHVRSDGHAQPYDTRWQRADGTLIDVAVTVSALRGASGDLTGFTAMAQDITQRVAIQAELAVARAESEVLAERDRIARDLHDTVIQRVFGAGLALQSAVSQVIRPAVADRINSVIGDLDATIKELRGAIFDLHHSPQRAARLGVRLVDLATSAQRGLGFEPVITLTGPVDTVPDVIGTHVLAVAQEALSNIIRHAYASAAEIALDVGTELVLQVTDNGRGLGPTARASGLANLRERAEAFGGTFEITGQPGAGTRLRWCVPLSSTPNADTNERH